MEHVRKIVWAVALVAVVFCGYVLVSYVYQSTSSSGQSQSGSSGRVIRTNADIGGPYELTAHTGETVSSADFKGKYQLVYFGFIYCPDICPTELQAMTTALDQLPPKMLEKVQPVFITVDPERDTPREMARYVELFHPKLIGLTGSPAQIKDVAGEFKVYYQKVEDAGASDYLMDHSTFTYLMDPEGKLVAIFRYPLKPDDVVTVLKEEIGPVS